MLNNDETEGIRRAAVSLINENPRSREQLEECHGQVWDTKQLTDDFQLQSFLAPLVYVRRSSDGIVGSMVFQHSPRYYFKFKEDK